MGKFLDIPFDVFFKIFEWAGAESLFMIGQCNRKYKDWARNELLWKEIIHSMQERGVLLPADGFIGLESMSYEQLKRCALRACRIRRKWSSVLARPSKSYLVDCNPSWYQPGTLHTTQRLRWVIPITDDFFAVKLGYHLSSGFLEIWQRGMDAPRIVIRYRGDWVHWGHCTDLAGKAWYFVFSEHNVHQFAHTLHVMRFTGFEADPRVKLRMDVVGGYPIYGSIINVFVLDAARKSLCALYAGSPNNTVTMFFVPDWLKSNSVHIDTGVSDDFATISKRSFICWLDTPSEWLIMQFEPALGKKKARQYVYKLDDLAQHALSVPAMPFPTPHPPLLEPAHVFDLDFMDTPRDADPLHEQKSLVSVNHHYTPMLPNASATRIVPTISQMAFASSFGHDLNPTYIFRHTYVGLAGARPFVRRVVTPPTRRMAFEQDYMDTNSTQRFPRGHTLDLLGHELISLGHGCAAWIEARCPAFPNVIHDHDRAEYDLKVVLFPWKMEGSGREGCSRARVDSNSEADLSVCTVVCPPEVDLARVTGIWLDAVQGRIFIGMKWGKFMVLQFD